MVATTLDRLLATLDVMLNAFAACEIQQGYRLRFDPMDTVVVHYVLAGSGVLCLGNGSEAALHPDRIVIVPPRQAQVLGVAEVRGPVQEVVGDERCARLEAGGLVRFTAGKGGDEGGTPLLVVCGTITASYGGGFGLFDTLLSPLAADAAEVPGLHDAFSLLFAELSYPGVGTRALAEALMTQCLVLLLRRELARNSSSQLFLALRDPRLARAVVGVLQHPADPYTVASLAAMAGMSRTSFAERFQAAYGETPLDFVQRVRLRHGATLLRTTALPVKAIAAAVGYASRSHFSRAFHAAYGIDPRGYRRIKLPDTDPGRPEPSEASDQMGVIT